MKTILALAIVLASTSAFAAKKISCVKALSPQAKVLKAWSSSGFTVQGVIFRALEAAYAKNPGPDSVLSLIKKTGKYTFRLNDGTSSLVCRSRQRSAEPFMGRRRKLNEYSCEITGPIDEPTMNARSVQATLLQVLSDYANEAFPPDTVSMFKGGSYVLVSYDGAVFRCEGKAEGMAAVQRYACTLSAPVTREPLEEAPVAQIPETSAASSLEALAAWNPSAVSVQALLHKALEKSYNEKLARDVTMRFIGKSNGTYTIESQNAKLTCSAKSGEMLPYQMYRCLVEGDTEAWVMDANSVQAVLYKALEDAKNDPQASGVEIMQDGPTLSVTSEGVTLKCTAKSRGMLPVQQYSCQWL